MAYVSLTGPRIVGRYALCGDIAAGGMATVHYGRLLGPAGFSRTVAIKRLHAQFARDADFVSMFLDEARLAARIRHLNVVQTIDIVALEGELFLVMDYVPGEALSRLLRACAAKKQLVPLDVVSGIACGLLHGLHAAHEATADTGEPLGIVHRDVSPQNVIIGTDGIPRVLDFGVAKAAGRTATTREGQVKGKFAYMAPEQVASGEVDRRTDIYAAGVVLWEMLTLERLFPAENDAQLINQVLRSQPRAPGCIRSEVSPALDALTLRALAKDPAQRFADTRQMALELEAVLPLASPTRIAAWLEGLAGAVLAERAKSVALIESNSSGRHQALQDLLKESLTPRPAAVPPGHLHASLSLPSSKLADSKEAVTQSASGANLQVEPQPRRRGSGFLYGALAVLALTCAALAGSMMLSRGPAESSTSSPPTVSVAAAPSSSAPAVSVASPVPSDSTATPHADASAEAPAASGSSAPEIRTGKAPPSKPPVKAKPPSGPTQPADPNGHCTIKSFVDETGIEHFTKECY
jgi:eukaryotic-like serine/threonine-protein kinase